VNACMHRLSATNIVHQGGRSVVEREPVDSEIGGVMGGLLVNMTQYVGLSASLPMLTSSFWCSGISPKEVTTSLGASYARSLPLTFVCPLILCNNVGKPSLAIYWSMETMDNKRALL
jgi:hypothetical protein